MLQLNHKNPSGSHIEGFRQGTASAVPSLTPIKKALAAEGVTSSPPQPHLRGLSTIILTVIIPLVECSRSEWRLASARLPKNPKSNLLSGDFYVHQSLQGPFLFVFFHLYRRPPVPHSPGRASVPLRVPRPQGRSSPCCRGRWQGHRLSPFRQLCVRLRSQLRPRTPLLRCRPRSVKPKTASTLAYLGQTLVQNLHLAHDEYINALG